MISVPEFWLSVWWGLYRSWLNLITLDCLCFGVFEERVLCSSCTAWPKAAKQWHVEGC